MPRDDIYVIDDGNVLTVDPPEQRARAARAVPSDLHQPAFATSGAVPQFRTPAPAGSWRPVAAGTLSFLICGAGQAFNGQRQLGLLFFVIELLVVAVHWSAGAMWGFLQEMGYIFEVSPQQMLGSLAVFDALFIFFVLVNVVQAWRRASIDSGGVGGIGNPLVSALASALLPGVGQLCNAQPLKAVFFFSCLLGGALASASLVLEPFATWFRETNLVGRITEQGAQAVAGIVFVAGALWVLCVYDALVVARYRRSG